MGLRECEREFKYEPWNCYVSKGIRMMPIVNRARLPQGNNIVLSWLSHDLKMKKWVTGWSKGPDPKGKIPHWTFQCSLNILKDFEIKILNG